VDPTLIEVARNAIDAMIDGWVGRPASITMSFSLVEAFMQEGLLDRIEYTVGGEQWLLRTYRGRVIQPDPALKGWDFYFGLRIYES
jgi:hypothetical protein